MAQLGSATIAAAISAFTGDRLDGTDAEVLRMIDAALIVARRETGWHVSPVIEGNVIVLDGPCSRQLGLPTRKLVALNSVKELTVTLDLAKLTWSAGGPPGLLERPATVRKRSGAWWSGDYRAITVDMDHGYTEDEAGDWRQAIMSMVDQMSLVPVGGSGFSGASLKTKRIDDVAYGWDPSYTMAAENVLFSVDHILTDYCLPRVEFM
jgi:hypothetical protein